MGLLHDFIVTDRIDMTCEEFDNERSWVNRKLVLKNMDDIKGYFTIHNDLINYIYDAIRWIPVKNFAINDEETQGLCSYGLTKIDGESLKLYAKLFRHWIGIFSLAPDELYINGGYVTNPDGTGGYEELNYKKVELLSVFEKAVENIQLAIDNKYIIIHAGI